MMLLKDESAFSKLLVKRRRAMIASFLSWEVMVLPDKKFWFLDFCHLETWNLFSYFWKTWLREILAKILLIWFTLYQRSKLILNWRNEFIKSIQSNSYWSHFCSWIFFWKISVRRYSSNFPIVSYRSLNYVLSFLYGNYEILFSYLDLHR